MRSFLLLLAGHASALTAVMQDTGALNPLEEARAAVVRGDQDGDDMLNKAEFTAEMHKSSALRKAVFSALDLDRDGQMDAEPFQALEKLEKEEVKKEVVAEKESQMDALEFEKQMRSSASFRKAIFTHLDLDRDGQMDAEPFEALEKVGGAAEKRETKFVEEFVQTPHSPTLSSLFSSADRNNDGALDSGEGAHFASLVAKTQGSGPTSQYAKYRDCKSSNPAGTCDCPGLCIKGACNFLGGEIEGVCKEAAKV